MPALYLSVVIPTRNRPIDLLNCLTALAGQVHPPPYEILIVDDHSKPEFLGDYSNVLIRFSHLLNIRYSKLPGAERGAVQARIAAVRLAEGEVVGFLDDDSVPSPLWASTIAQHFQECAAIVAATGFIDAVDQRHPLSAFRQSLYDARYSRLLESHTKLTLERRFGIKSPANYHLADFLSGGNSAVRASALKDAGNFNPSFKMMHDKELALRLLARGLPCVYLPQMAIKHNHTKSVLDALSKAFRSGKYQHRLRTTYSDILTEPVVGINRPFETIRRARRSLITLGWNGLAIIPVICALEYLHQLAYVVESLKPKLGMGKEKGGAPNSHRSLTTVKGRTTKQPVDLK